MAQVDARMGEIEEKLQAEIEAEELAFREKEEKEKPRAQSRAAGSCWYVDRWKISLRWNHGWNGKEKTPVVFE